jgi:8-oxo-dGTP pyrophosphatase MutT (NUDIX family)
VGIIRQFDEGSSEWNIRARVPVRAYLAYARFRRAMTLGVRGAVFDKDGRVFLIRHSYVPGWYFPGGGVEVGETMEDALGRELMEEGGIKLGESPRLFGVYFNRALSRRDHVALYVAREWSQPVMPKLPNFEVVDAGFFAPDALPEDTSAGTRRRLAEILGQADRSPEW